jgi:uncharacterized protein (DUF1778 family)
VHQKKPRGRPKLNPEAVRRFTISVTVTAAERKAIRAAAEADDQSASTWVRAVALEALRRHRR